MKRFKLGLRVRVVHPENAARDPLRGMTGRVVRMRRADDLAWVQMDVDLPEGFASFPEGDDRHRNIMMGPEECESVKERP